MYYYRNKNKTAYWKVKNPLSEQREDLIEITEQEYNKHIDSLYPKKG